MDIREATRTFAACGDNGLACAEILCAEALSDASVPKSRRIAATRGEG